MAPIKLGTLKVVPVRNSAATIPTKAPGKAAGFASFAVEGLPAVDLTRRLWERHRIFVTSLTHLGLDAIRVTPSFYTTVGEVDRFVTAVEAELAAG